jgi:hypothetical protein
MRIRILFEDEACFGRISDHRRCWAPLPKRPDVGRQVVRQFVYNMAAVSPYDGALSSLIVPYVDAEIMSVFLAQVAKEFKGEFCLVFVDGAGWHHARGLRIPRYMKLLFLPPYSPELNPAELLWEHLRENHFANHAYETLAEVEDVLCEAVRNLMDDTAAVKSMTLFPWLNTLRLMYN